MTEKKFLVEFTADEFAHLLIILGEAENPAWSIFKDYADNVSKALGERCVELDESVIEIVKGFKEIGEIEEMIACLDGFLDELIETECGESDWFEIMYRRRCEGGDEE